MNFYEGDLSTYYPPAKSNHAHAHCSCVILPPRVTKVLVDVHTDVCTFRTQAPMTRIRASNGPHPLLWVPSKAERKAKMLEAPSYPCTIVETLARAKPNAKRYRIRFVSEDHPKGCETTVSVDRLVPNQGELMTFSGQQLAPLVREAA